MKKIFSVFLIFALAAVLCACGVESVVPESTPVPTVEPTAEPTPVPTVSPMDADFENMLAGFSEIRAGSSGSSLRAVQQAVKLLDWGTATNMNIDEISARTAAFMQSMDGDAAESYKEQLAPLYSTYRQLLTEGQEDLLESAGCENTAYPWGGAPLAGIEAIFETAGMI